MNSIIKFVLVAVVGFVPVVGWTQTNGEHCTKSFVITMHPGNSNPSYEFRGVHYPAYPLDVFNKLLNVCPNTQEINFIVDPKTSAQDILIAYGAAKKTEFQVIKFFIAGPSYYYPFSIGDGTSKPEAK